MLHTALKCDAQMFIFDLYLIVKTPIWLALERNTEIIFKNNMGHQIFTQSIFRKLHESETGIS